MGRMILCIGRYAKKPYHFNGMCVNVYCVEELCYLFASNPFMIDNDVMDKELAEWLDRECGLTELSHQLLTLFQRGCQPGIFVSTILDYVNFCTPQEKAKIEEVLQGSVGLNDFERRKKQADYLMKNHRYHLAIDEYDRLIRELPETESALQPSIFHNMGTAYAGFFLFDMAAKYFKRAYDMTGSTESGVSFLAAKRLFLHDEAYIAFIAEHEEYHELSLLVEKKLTDARGQFEASRENRMLSALKIYKEEGNVSSYYEEIDKIIAQLKNEYRQLVEA
ncbi:MAG: tetratricopeptide repeat protein [Lachnospiraceae bacterium]|nr:tetratricopeptide repeat protein [Lachnospiraceae bacterium]